LSAGIIEVGVVLKFTTVNQASGSTPERWGTIACGDVQESGVAGMNYRSF